MKATFDKTVSILVKAYLNGELLQGVCTRCVVGNLISSSGYKFKYDTVSEDSHWLRYLKQELRGYRWYDKGDINYAEAKKQLNSTGYSYQELDRLEFTFEMAPPGKDDDEEMFNGLMAVVDVLADIHSVDLSVKEEAKQLFVKVQ